MVSSPRRRQRVRSGSSVMVPAAITVSVTVAVVGKESGVELAVMFGDCPR